VEGVTRGTGATGIAETAAWLARAARGSGLTLARLVSSDLIRACDVPDGWSLRYTAITLQDLICEATRGLPDALDSRVALAALNQMPEVVGASPTGRFKSLSQLEMSRPVPDFRAPVHPSTLARHWRGIRRDLATVILTEIDHRNGTGWTKYAKIVQMHKGVDLQPFVIERLEVTYFIDKDRVCTETMTQRWLKADLSDSEGLSSIDHYKVRAMYRDPQDGQELPTTEILPMLNCRAGATDVGQDGWLMTPMYFAKPVPHRGTVFFASRVRHVTSVPIDPAAFIQVTSLGIIKLIMRVQFDPGAVPTVCWVYGGASETGGKDAPREAVDARWRSPNALGYVEYRTENCPPGWYYTIGWEWPV
jgi:hypothetical protein